MFSASSIARRKRNRDGSFSGGGGPPGNNDDDATAENRAAPPSASFQGWRPTHAPPPGAIAGVTFPLTKLCPDILVSVFTHLSPADRVAFSCVSVAARKFVYGTPSVWPDLRVGFETSRSAKVVLFGTTSAGRRQGRLKSLESLMARFRGRLRSLVSPIPQATSYVLACGLNPIPSRLQSLVLELNYSQETTKLLQNCLPRAPSGARLLLNGRLGGLRRVLLLTEGINYALVASDCNSTFVADLLSSAPCLEHLALPEGFVYKCHSSMRGGGGGRRCRSLDLDTIKDDPLLRAGEAASSLLKSAQPVLNAGCLRVLEIKGSSLWDPVSLLLFLQSAPRLSHLALHSADILNVSTIFAYYLLPYEFNHEMPADFRPDLFSPHSLLRADALETMIDEMLPMCVLQFHKSQIGALQKHLRQKFHVKRFFQLARFYGTLRNVDPEIIKQLDDNELSQGGCYDDLEPGLPISCGMVKLETQPASSISWHVLRTRMYEMANKQQLAKIIQNVDKVAGTGACFKTIPQLEITLCNTKSAFYPIPLAPASSSFQNQAALLLQDSQVDAAASELSEVVDPPWHLFNPAFSEFMQQPEGTFETTDFDSHAMRQQMPAIAFAMLMTLSLAGCASGSRSLVLRNPASGGGGGGAHGKPAAGWPKLGFYSVFDEPLYHHLVVHRDVLRRLVIDRPSPGLSEKALDAISLCANLETLSLCNAGLHMTVLKVASIFHNCRALKMLDLSLSAGLLAGDWLQLLTSNNEENRTAYRLWRSAYGVGDGGCSSAARVDYYRGQVPVLERLHTLRLCGTALNDNDLFRIANSIPSLRHIDVSNCVNLGVAGVFHAIQDTFRLRNQARSQHDPPYLIVSSNRNVRDKNLERSFCGLDFAGVSKTVESSWEFP